MSVVVETTIGDLTIDLYTQERPRTCLNFLKLCKMKYYNFNLMYSLEQDFIAQTGDPSGSGKGGESIYGRMFGEQAKYYEGEKLPVMKHKDFGTVSMVSCGSNLFSSQWFITLGENLDSLDREHLVFGKIVEGVGVLNKLNKALTDDNNRPFQDIRITHTVILDDPFPDPEELTFPAESPVPTKEMLESDYIGADEDIDDTEGKSMEQIQEEIAEKEAKARATILEMVGDLPEADAAPPENVLFVCKLNPVTTSEDLEIIFSRFGRIVSCEVIRDRQNNASLQYAFVEFSETKSCEDAYFKMDNVLIDDRRIHVDFSQSVSKIRWRGKGRGVEYFDESGRKVDNSKWFDPNKDLRGGGGGGGRGGVSGSRGHFARRGRGGLDRNNERRDLSRDTHRGGNIDRRERDRYGGGERHHRDGERDRFRNGRVEERRPMNIDSREKESHSRDRNASRNLSQSGGSDAEDHLTLPSDGGARQKMMKKLRKELKRKKKHKHDGSSDSDSEGSGEKKEKEKEKEKKKKKKKKKKKVKDGNNSDSEDSEPKKKKKKKSKKKKKKKESSGSES
ncbi:peptidyl-prolyl cis-trans isomerase sig-7 [Oratosquilla oratoria]|uniref:peptidyl-prolyl cis-trans isomerase sig-7 n=1 Tax=Oratosquilla oratoria TaxID=337810 RepID=UPI003F7670FD